MLVPSEKPLLIVLLLEVLQGKPEFFNILEAIDPEYIVVLPHIFKLIRHDKLDSQHKEVFSGAMTSSLSKRMMEESFES